MIALGKVAATDGALRALAAAGVSPATLLARYQRGEQGDIPPAAIGVRNEDTLYGVVAEEIYRLATGDAIWITTCARYPVTTLLALSADYLADFFGL